MARNIDSRIWALMALAGLASIASARSAQETGETQAFIPYEEPALRLVNSVAFAPDDEVMYFALLQREVLAHLGLPVEGAPETALFSASRTAEGWSDPELLPFSGEHKDYEPTLSADGSLMVFNSQRPWADGRTPEHNDLWMVAREDDEWGEPERIETLTTFDNGESYATLTADRTLVFMCGRPGADGEPSHDLYSSRFVDGAFAEAERHPVSTDRFGEGDPWIAPDGSYLIFTRWDDAVGWEGSVDLYIAFQAEGVWSEPVALEELNSAGPDFAPAVSSDGRWLYTRTSSRFQRRPLAPVLDRYRPR